jgi:hypothetical protein
MIAAPRKKAESPRSNKSTFMTRREERTSPLQGVLSSHFYILALNPIQLHLPSQLAVPNARPQAQRQQPEPLQPEPPDHHSD